MSCSVSSLGGRLMDWAASQSRAEGDAPGAGLPKDPDRVSARSGRERLVIMLVGEVAGEDRHVPQAIVGAKADARVEQPVAGNLGVAAVHRVGVEMRTVGEVRVTVDFEGALPRLSERLCHVGAEGQTVCRNARQLDAG